MGMDNTPAPIGTAYLINVPARMSYVEPDVVVEAHQETRYALACPWFAPRTKSDLSVDEIISLLGLYS